MIRFLFGLVVLLSFSVPLNSSLYPKTPFDLPEVMTQGFPEDRVTKETYQLGINNLGSRTIEIIDPDDNRIGKVMSVNISNPHLEWYFLYREGEVETLDQTGSTLAIFSFDKGRLIGHKGQNFQAAYHWNEETSMIDRVTTTDPSGEVIWDQQIIFDDQGRVVQDTFNIATGETDLDPSFTRYLSYNEDGTISATWLDDGHYVWHNYDPETKQFLGLETHEFQVESQFDENGNTTSLSVIDKETGNVYGSYVVMMPQFCENPGPQQLVRQDTPSFFSLNTVWRSINAIARYLNQAVEDELTECIETYKVLDTAYQIADDVGCELLGPFPMRFFGFRQSQSETGVYGEGCEPAKFRITFVNGILTTIEDLRSHMQLISEAHGGVNVHYCYVGSKGWTNDLVRSGFCKLGVISPEAKELAQIWRDMIEELGGTESGGVIFHYAHSLGGTETHLAKFMLTPEELKMIRVITFGSPTLIPNEGFHSVMNLISCRDVISAFDPVGFFSALLFDTNSFFVGSHYDGPPIVDHPFYSYWTYLREHFWDEFEELIEELK